MGVTDEAFEAYQGDTSKLYDNDMLLLMIDNKVTGSPSFLALSQKQRGGL